MGNGKNLRKLWIDDVRDPKRFVPDPENWDWVKSYTEALRALYGCENPDTVYYHVSFDHDLGANSFQVELSGYDIARVIERDAATKKKIKPFSWAVHSANPVGAERIRMSLKKADEFWNEK